MPQTARPSSKSESPRKNFGRMHTNKTHRKVNAACKENPELEETWTFSDSVEGFTWGLSWEKKDGDCLFDCQTIFPTFEDASNRIYDDGLEKNGVIHTDCGSAIYVAYQLGQ